ncbi:hypothetical protein K1T36_21000 [Pseudomonas protegens]|uniref:hypothetical protein n=1 Tax=Pseudomonas protegens TaxID=380021 RepID=UPI001C6A5D07|nr:hypothetical protein [Pseudomonas protegens]QYM99545.1 hypothetical protein K1T36_21000 [Pseudomonas protegens]
MSNETISVPRDLAVDLLDGLRITQERARKELRALLAKPAEQHQGNAVAAEVCAYTPGMGQVELKLPSNLPSWLELGETVTVLHGNAQPQEETEEPYAYAYEWATWISTEGPKDFKLFIEREAPPQWAAEEGQAKNIIPLYTRPAEQPEPISSTSDKYKAELYEEVWQLARDMGFGNVTDALMKLQGNKS